jgi:hypothetical protein
MMTPKLFFSDKVIIEDMSTANLMDQCFTHPTEFSTLIGNPLEVMVTYQFFICVLHIYSEVFGSENVFFFHASLLKLP